MADRLFTFLCSSSSLFFPFFLQHKPILQLGFSSCVVKVVCVCVRKIREESFETLCLQAALVLPYSQLILQTNILRFVNFPYFAD